MGNSCVGDVSYCFISAYLEQLVGFAANEAS